MLIKRIPTHELIEEKRDLERVLKKCKSKLFRDRLKDIKHELRCRHNANVPTIPRF